MIKESLSWIIILIIEKLRSQTSIFVTIISIMNGKFYSYFTYLLTFYESFYEPCLSS